MQQFTIKDSITIEGPGVHSGVISRLTLRPAEIDQGIYFLLDGVIVEANLDNIIGTQYCTILGKDNVSISTVEHLLACIVACGIDNICLEIASGEIPIMDGSAYDFLFCLKTANLIAQQAISHHFTISEIVKIEKEDGRFCILEPSDDLIIEFSFSQFYSKCIEDNPSAKFAFSLNSFEHDLARARTFGSLSDYDKLLSLGFAKGASLDNILVLDENGPIKNQYLRFINEPARHKVLDAIGDLALLSPKLKARFIGHGSGHSMHYELITKAKEYLVQLF